VQPRRCASRNHKFAVPTIIQNTVYARVITNRLLSRDNPTQTNICPCCTFFDLRTFPPFYLLEPIRKRVCDGFPAVASSAAAFFLSSTRVPDPLFACILLVVVTVLASCVFLSFPDGFSCQFTIASMFFRLAPIWRWFFLLSRPHHRPRDVTCLFT